MESLRPLAVDKIGDVLAIAWSDGREDFLALPALRAACPCAACNGEPDVTGKWSGKILDARSANADLRGWEFVGGYGLQPRWGDGHASGIYAYPLLRKLGKAEREG